MLDGFIGAEKTGPRGFGRRCRNRAPKSIRTQAAPLTNALGTRILSSKYFGIDQWFSNQTHIPLHLEQ